MDGDLVGEYSANDHGVVEVGPLAPGFYVVKQIIAPAGYSICTETQTIEVISGRVLNARFANYKLEGIVIESVDQTTHKGLPNTTFEIYNEDNIQVFHGVTDASRSALHRRAACRPLHHPPDGLLLTATPPLRP